MSRPQLSIAFLALCIAVFATTATVHASAESFSLIESASVSRDIFANEGDRLVGNFTFSNIPTWTDSNTGKSETVEYAFKIAKSEGPEKCPHEIELYGSYQKEQGSFDVYCEYTGSYRLRFNVGIVNPAAGIGNMTATLNYDVVKSSSGGQKIENPPASSDLLNETPSPSTPELSAWLVLPLCTAITLVAFTIRKKKRSASSFRCDFAELSWMTTWLESFADNAAFRGSSLTSILHLGKNS